MTTRRKPYPTTSRTAAYKVRERELNRPLLLKLARYIERHPERYDQTQWYSDAELERAGCGQEEEAAIQYIHKPTTVCGTVACVAGHAVVQSGAPLIKVEDAWGSAALEWALTAQYKLGLDEDLAEWLFDGDRRQETMPQILRAIANGETNIEDLRGIEYPGEI